MERLQKRKGTAMKELKTITLQVPPEVMDSLVERADAFKRAGVQKTSVYSMLFQIGMEADDDEIKRRIMGE